MEKYDESDASYRWHFLVFVFVLLFLGLAIKLVYIQVYDKEYILESAKRFQTHNIPIPAKRGRIYDRNGELLAEDTILYDVIIDPIVFIAYENTLQDIAVGYSETVKKSQKRNTFHSVVRILKLDTQETRKKLKDKAQSRYLLLKKQVTPQHYKMLKDLKSKGIHFTAYYKRYYPLREATAQMIGFTNGNRKAIGGVEQGMDGVLRGENGTIHIHKDGIGRKLATLPDNRPVKHGENLKLSIDLRLQYFAYKELLAAVKTSRAEYASLVAIDGWSGQVLALATYPSFNPNYIQQESIPYLVNHSVQTAFEPGSTIKPLIMAYSLQEAAVRGNESIVTSPGSFRIGKHRIRDPRDYGDLTLTDIIKKSSNVGMAKIALRVNGNKLYGFLSDLGVGITTGVGLANEASGKLPLQGLSSQIARATSSYGYGFTTTPLQLATMYTVFTNNGKIRRPSLFYSNSATNSRRILSEVATQQTLSMMASVVKDGGTGKQADMTHFSTAGKTGTTQWYGDRGYESGVHNAMFVGVAPLNNPRYVVAVMVSKITADKYYGGAVAAPVYRNTMEKLLLMEIENDPDLYRKSGVQ